MKKYIASILLILLIGGNLNAAIPVIVTKDSPEHIIKWAQEIRHHFETLGKLVQQLRQAVRTTTATMKMIEQLKQGDWKGIVRAAQHGADTVSGFSSFLDDMPDMTKIRVADETIIDTGSKKFKNLKETTEEINETTRMTADALWSVNELIDNSKMRIEHTKRLIRMSQETDSIVGQAQIFNQGLGLLQGEISDIVKITTIQSRHDAAKDKDEENDDTLSKIEARAFFTSTSSDSFKPIPMYTEDEVYDAMRGWSYLEEREKTRNEWDWIK